MDIKLHVESENLLTLPDIDSAIGTLEKKLEELKAHREAVSRKSPEHVLAEKLHSKQCRWDHTSGCDWYYGSWESPRYAQGEYLTKARKILGAAKGDLSVALAMIEVI